MRIYLHYFTLILLLTLLVVPMISVYAATVYLPEIQVDDWMLYDVSASWKSDNPSATAPQFVRDMNATEWSKIEVINVISTRITVLSTIHYKNNTEDTSIYRGDIRTGSGNLSTQIIASNLSAGDFTWEEHSDPIYINRTFWLDKNLTSGIVRREVNEADFKKLHAETDTFIESAIIGDRKTGILIRSIIYLSGTDILNPWEAILVTSLSDVKPGLLPNEPSPNFSGIERMGVLVAIIVIALIAIVIVVKKRKKTRKKIRKHGIKSMCVLAIPTTLNNGKRKS